MYVAFHEIINSEGEDNSWFNLILTIEVIKDWLNPKIIKVILIPDVTLHNKYRFVVYFIMLYQHYSYPVKMFHNN